MRASRVCPRARNFSWRFFRLASGCNTHGLYYQHAPCTPGQCHYARPPWSPCIVLLIYAKVGLAAGLPSLFASSCLRFPPIPVVSISTSLVRCTVNYGVRATKSSGLIELLLESRQYGARRSATSTRERERERKRSDPSYFYAFYCPFVQSTGNDLVPFIFLFFFSVVLARFSCASATSNRERVRRISSVMDVYVRVHGGNTRGRNF